MSGITVTCFAASYAVALGLEASRLLFRSGVRGVVMLGFAGAGLLAHSLFLASRLTRYEAGGVTGWFEWFLLAAWILAATYLYLTYYHPRYPFGLFVLPLVLTLIGIGYSLRLQAGFLGGARVWGLIHGWSLLLGTVIVLIGFVAGLMYLIEANRLKQKRPPASRFRLPSLEWAERVNGRTLVLSTILLGVGVLSGLALNAINHVRGDSAMPWSDPVVWSSAVLLGWLLTAAIFNFVYRPARRGRKVAYLTLASMVFLLLVLGVLLWAPSQHPASQADRENPPAASRVFDGITGWTGCESAVAGSWPPEKHPDHCRLKVDSNDIHSAHPVILSTRIITLSAPLRICLAGYPGRQVILGHRGRPA